MSTKRAIVVYVVSMLAGAVAVLFYTAGLPKPSVDYWALISLAIVGLLLEMSWTANKSNTMAGSLVFVMHLAIGVSLGGFWGAITAAFVTGVSQLYSRLAPLKVVFNIAERMLSVGVAFTVYSVIGGRHPPEMLDPSLPPVSFESILLQIAVFMVAALVYFIVNSLAVNGAVAISSGKSVFLTWRSNTLWVLGYDLGASLLALGVAYLFVRFDHAQGFWRLGFVAIFLPFAIVKHFYGKVNELQSTLHELDDAYAQLELNVREQLAVMVKAIEARDPYTSGHSRRVCGLSRAIATDLGVDTEHLELIENAALLHDVGKIHAEFAPLLQKEDKLTDEEWGVMKTHSIKSAELVSMFSRFQGYVVACVRHHHERWDGRGYPDGVSGSSVPLGARIIAIADTIDAMTTNRPYRGALPLEVVLSELNKGRGTQFDPDLVELTVNSVTVRRLIADPALIPEYLPQPRIRARAEAARASQPNSTADLRKQRAGEH